MRIKSLQINGFKSFVDKSVLAFQPGITAIVGPNGCGKSNVVDAMRWAMGEQSPRHLRGKSMEDVIFAGSDSREGVGMAEVVLTFDNSDGRAPAAYAGFTEIQVGRRLFRTGDSEYRINRTPCRLRDVLDFFRDTGIGTRGYTIVEQGQIASIVSAKPDDRRAMLEEAAGISKYKARRREAERKLTATEQNLTRVSDVLGEIRRQISSLERQARKAARYKRFQERLRLLELSIAAEDRRALAEQRRVGDARLMTQRDGVTAAETQLAEREAGLERARLELAERERAAMRNSEVLFALRSEIKQLESRIEYEQRERGALAATREAHAEELGRLREQLALAQTEEREAADERTELDAQLQGEGAGLTQLEGEARSAAAAARQLEGEREATNGRLVDALTAVARAEDRLSVLEERHQEVNRRLRSADEALEVQQGEANRVDDVQRRLEDGLRNLLAERDRLMGAQREALERSERTGRAARESVEWVREAREKRDLRQARLASLRELLERGEDVDAGTRHLLARSPEARTNRGLRGLIRAALDAEPEVERAVEAVLGPRAGAIAASRLDGALSALEELRAADAGGAVFVVEPRNAPAPAGFVPLGEPLLDRVRVSPGYEWVARALLGGVNLVPDLNEVLKVYGDSIPATFVTPVGDVLTPDGVLRGGGASSGALARVRELRELDAEVAQLDQALATLEVEHAERVAASERASDELDNLRNRHHTSALAVASHDKDLELARERVKALGEAQEGRSAERSGLVQEGEGLESERSQLAGRIETLRQERLTLQSALDGLSGRIGQAVRDQQRLDTALTERRVGLTGRREKRDRLEQTRERAAQAARSAADFIARRERETREIEARREGLAASTRDAESQLAAKLVDEERLRGAADSAKDDFEVGAGEVRRIEEALRSQRGQVQAKREAVQNLELELREVVLRLEQLDERMRDRWQVELASWSPPPIAESVPPTASLPDAHDEEEEGEPTSISSSEAELVALPREARALHLEDVKRRLQSLGEVNLGAIEEHEELSERFRFLTEQKDDLETTVNSLREAISRINRTSRKRFRETFEAVDKRFRENFPRLFSGGRASLTLTESEDVLDAGVEIMAQPPGKRLQSVSLLSGGEKTLTALALLVSLFQVHPSPFFLLDEVDAALDDTNVARLNTIVRELSQDSQFLMITHNKSTIEFADVLYGVTMEEKGTSKLVSVQLRD